MTDQVPVKKPKLTPHEQSMHELYKSLPKELPEKLPGAGVVIAEVEGEPGILTRIIKAPDADKYVLVRDRADDRQILTPIVTPEQMEDVATAVLLGWQRIVTWPHAVNVLALGAALRLSPTLAEPVPVVDPPAPAAPAMAQAVPA